MLTGKANGQESTGQTNRSLLCERSDEGTMKMSSTHHLECYFGRSYVSNNRRQVPLEVDSLRKIIFLLHVAD